MPHFASRLLATAALAWVALAGACTSAEPPEAAAVSGPASAPSPASASAAAVSAAPARPGSAAATTYGQALGDDRQADLPIASVLGAPDQHGDRALTVKGVVSAVCQRRGCWLELAGEGEGARGCRVVSEHHDWFIPRDAVGQSARVRGRLEVRRIPAAQVAHMESEGGRFADKLPDGSAREVRIVASGVELSPRG